ncbi:ABC transporter permease [Paenibacillus chitinolyticus]|uniref:ABC transporter permease n=1 Tax=Paenibacillus chitinolyticus TaxID=79263 RepID=UPI003633A156
MILLKKMLSSLKDFFKSQKMIIMLAKKDFKNKHLGSVLGIAWAFLQPLISLLIFWFVFQVGFKATPIDNFPFILWLATGMIVWNFFADSVNGGTQSIVENSYLVKKIVFKVSVLPVIKIYSSFVVHLFFILVLFIIFIVYGIYPTLYVLQTFYYLFALFMLLLAITWITSSLTVFFKDVGQVVSMILQFGFWLTPVFYSFAQIPGKYQSLMKLNPMFYIVEGYRDSFIYKHWFWEHPKLTIVFWTETFILLIIAYILFKKLRPHFADVL